jgi:hypothetical protein
MSGVMEVDTLIVNGHNVGHALLDLQAQVLAISKEVQSLRELCTELEYAPNMPGYVRAHAHFDEAKNTLGLD